MIGREVTKVKTAKRKMEKDGTRAGTEGIT
jgi:hypothetical protein